MEVSKERIDRMVQALARAACQDFDHQIAVSEIDDDFLQLEIGLNVLLQDLKQAQEQNRAHLLEIEQKNQEIADRQSRALRELSTPIISVWSGVLTLPVVGMVDTERSADMMDRLLERVVAEEANFVVIDITGVSVVDTRTADHFIRMSEAVRLLGAECFLTGISPEIAQTISQLGIDTSRIRTLRRLSDALHLVFGRLGMGGKPAAAQAPGAPMPAPGNPQSHSG